MNETFGHCNPKNRNPAYSSWAAMLTRCRNKANHAYANYGARGVSVCKRWLTYANFYADMGPRPEGTTLDRIDNSKGYFPGNCRWADWVTQIRNSGHVRPITFQGRTMLLTDWASELGMCSSTLHLRLKKLSVEDALTRPLRKWGV